MNRDIAQYVLQLRDRVTRRQHHVLLVLACHHQEARETYWPARAKLALELSMDESQLRRIIGELEQTGILKHVPGVGAGNRSSFVFLELEKGDVKGDKKGDKKGDNSDPLIRKDRTFTSTKPPNPLSENPNCEKHPNSGLTPWGTCWSCYAEKHNPELKKEPQRVAG